MKIEAGKFYLTAQGLLARTFIADNQGSFIGALRDENDDTGEEFWEPWTWTENGRFGSGKRKSCIDLIEEIRVGPSSVSYAKQFDYCASYDNDEPDDDGNMSQGFGATELEAVMDLLQNYPGEERAEKMAA